MDLITRTGTSEQKVKVEPVDGGYEITVDDQHYHVGAVAQGAGRKSLLIGGRQYEVAAVALGEGEYRIGGRHFAGVVAVSDPLTHLAQATRGGGRARGKQVVKAYMPGRVAALLAEEGSAIKVGQGVVVLEAMKMENEIRAEQDGTLVKIFVTAGQAVEAGEKLFELE